MSWLPNGASGRLHKQHHTNEEEARCEEVEHLNGKNKKPVYSAGPNPSVPRHYNSDNPGLFCRTMALPSLGFPMGPWWHARA